MVPKEITIEDKELFDDHFRKHPQEISEMTFTNLFCWRKSKKHRYAVYKDHLLISFVDGNVRYYAPVGKDPVKIMKELLDEGKVFEKVPKNIAEQMEGYCVKEQKEHHDYIYNIEDITSLEGGRYAQKRNQIRQFEKNEPEICRLTEKTVPKFAEMQERWKDMISFEYDYSLQAEDEAIKEVLDNFNDLDVSGVCIHVGEEIEGFSIGEKLNEDTYVEHFEKANIKLTGAYQYILKKFAENISGCIFLNREQDLGIEGIRKAKKSWNPVKLVEKFKITKQVS